jgi:pyruvate,water dikinase
MNNGAAMSREEIVAKTTAGGSLGSGLPTSVSFWSSARRRAVSAKTLRDNALQDDVTAPTDETPTLKESLIRTMIGDNKRLMQLADRYLTLDDLLRLRDRLIGSGRIGGKAAGMLLARAVLLGERSQIDFSRALEEHDSFHIGSDVFSTFLANNGLLALRSGLSKGGKLSRDEFADVEQRFLKGEFPEQTVERFRRLIDYYGEAPIIVRSSSLLEDGFSDSFAGKYRTEFCANQGSPKARLDAFLRAVRLVYASTLNPDALAYRHRRGLGEGEEQMAVLVQRVSGTPYKQYFFPSLAGVAFSRNLFAWTNRIDPKKGMIRLVFGLGTRAVNRVSGDYPRMIAVSHPDIRPEIGMEVARYSQRLVDLINLKEGTLETRPFADVIEGDGYPGLSLLVSEIADGYLRDWFTNSGNRSDKELVLTFNNLIKRTGMVKTIEEMLMRLEKAWRQPVDIEFTAQVDPQNSSVRINLLQCRALRVPTLAGTKIRMPERLSKGQILFRSSRAMNAGIVDDIRYIIYVDPKEYGQADALEIKRSLGRVIGKLNDSLRDKEGRILLMGPGRWGSNSLKFGVNVGYADIDAVAVLVEIASERGESATVSYGTHFFQDLVESDIFYLPVYPDDIATDFNRGFFANSPNILKDLLPELGNFENTVRVIDVSASTGGALAKVVADPETRNAVCFLDRGRTASNC